MPCACKSGRRTTLQLIEKYRHNNETYSFDFAPVEPLSWQEGDSSALVVNIESVGMEDSRKFSYATLPHENVVRFTTRIREKRSIYKDKLMQMSPGEFADITMPEGDFVLRREGRPALLLSNGVGIAAMRGLIKAFDHDKTGVDHLTQINVDATGAIYKEEMEALAQENSALRSIYLEHRQSLYPMIDDETRNLMFSTGRMPYFYLVGSDQFVQDIQQYLLASGFEDHDIITDLQGCNCGGSKIAVVKATNKVVLGRSIRLPGNPMKKSS